MLLFTKSGQVTNMAYDYEMFKYNGLNQFVKFEDERKIQLITPTGQMA